jgi:hypothetical protein
MSRRRPSELIGRFDHAPLLEKVLYFHPFPFALAVSSNLLSEIFCPMHSIIHLDESPSQPCEQPAPQLIVHLAEP